MSMPSLRLALAGVLLASAPVLAPVSAQTAPTVEAGSWVRLPAAAGRPAAGYFVLRGGPKADALVKATSPKVERIELHSMVMTDGVMRMRAEPSFAVPAKGELRFQPGGSHLMLFGLAADVKPGDRLPITLAFQSGATLAIEAVTRTPAEASGMAPSRATEKAGGHQGH